MEDENILITNDVKFIEVDKNKKKVLFLNNNNNNNENIKNNINNNNLNNLPNSDILNINTQKNNNNSNNSEYSKYKDFKEFNYASNLNHFFDVDEFLDKNGYCFVHYKLIFLSSLFFFIDGTEKMVLNLMLVTIREEWTLDRMQRSLLSSSIFLGFFVGSLISGFISNRFGRSSPVKICIFINFFFSIMSSFSWDIYSLFFCRVIMGLCLGVIIPSQTTLLVETIPNKNRGFVMNIIWTPFAIGIIYICLLSMHLIKEDNEFHWRKILFTNSLSSLIFGCLIINMKESPRFLLLKGRGRSQELIDILNEIAEANKTELTEDEKDYLNFILDESSDSQKALINLSNPSNLDAYSNINVDKRFKKFYTGSFVEHYNQFHQKYRSHNFSEQKNDLNIFCKSNNKLLNYLLVFIWFASSFISLGLFYILPKIYEKINDQDKTILLKNMIFSVAIILPCPIMRGIIADMKLFGRKYTILISFLGSAIMSMICLLVGKNMFVSAGILKFFINISVGIIQVYTMEVYPTNIRSLALGFGNGLNRLTGFLTPFLCETMESYIFRGTFYGFILFSVFGIIASYYLPYETIGKKLDFRDKELSMEEEKDKIVINSEIFR